MSRYFFFTRPHFLHEDLYLRVVIPPDYVRDHRLPRSGLAGVGASLSLALTKHITRAVGYGYGVDAPRGGGFGGHAVDTQFEFKY